jgi:16S rRNA (guanine966-N2)-methyltransferase
MGQPFYQSGKTEADSDSSAETRSPRAGIADMSRRSNTVRIIGGEHRGRLIRFPDIPGLRPTPDRVRETLFNWLGQDLSGKACLDLFSGSGALGVESSSRHAARVVLVDRAHAVVRAIRANAVALGLSNVTVEYGDALEFTEKLRKQRLTFDIIFLDPPFGEKWIERIEPLVPDLLADDGVAYIESEHIYLPAGGLRLLKQGRAGMVHFALAARAAKRGAVSSLQN